MDFIFYLENVLTYGHFEMNDINGYLFKYLYIDPLTNYFVTL